jgi:hypothetical protein
MEGRVGGSGMVLEQVPVGQAVPDGYFDSLCLSKRFPRTAFVAAERVLRVVRQGLTYEKPDTEG